MTTKPIEISHKSLVAKEISSDIFGLIYAKQTQFRVGQVGTTTAREQEE